MRWRKPCGRGTCQRLDVHLQLYIFIFNEKKDFFLGIVQPQGVRFDIGNPHTINTNYDHFDIFILGQLGPDFRFAKLHPKIAD